MNRRLISLIAIFLVAGIGAGYAMSLPQVSQLQSDVSSLKSEVSTLTTDYNTLNTTYNGLLSNHTDLNATYNELLTDYTNLNTTCNGLLAEYHTLNATYNELKTEYDSLEVSYDMLYKTHIQVQANYNLLVRTFDSPLHDKDVPSIEDLESWLQEDKTDEIQYDFPNFVCTEFALMLAINARAKDYDRGVVFIQGYINTTHEAFNHVLNAIITTEGLVYVEPQNDQVWWYNNHQAMTAEKVYQIWEGFYIDVKKIEIILAY